MAQEVETTLDSWAGPQGYPQEPYFINVVSRGKCFTYLHLLGVHTYLYLRHPHITHALFPPPSSSLSPSVGGLELIVLR